MANDVLISIPLFMFMGYVMERSGIMDRMFHSYRLLFGPLPGALALTTMVVGTIFGIASGIVGAGVTLMGVLALPPMLRAGYSVSLAAGTITSSGTLGILIPPSVMLIVYGASAGVSVVKLYAGAFGPGFLLSALFLLYILVACLVKPSLGPPLPKAERNISWRTLAREVAASSIPITSHRGGAGHYCGGVDHPHRGGGAGCRYVPDDCGRLPSTQLDYGGRIGAA